MGITHHMRLIILSETPVIDEHLQLKLAVLHPVTKTTCDLYKSPTVNCQNGIVLTLLPNPISSLCMNCHQVFSILGVIHQMPPTTPALDPTLAKLKS